MRYQPLLSWMASCILAGLPVSHVAASDVDAAGYYSLRCASCHGANGEGTRDTAPSLGPPLRGNPLVINAPVEMLMSIIRHGRGGQQRVYDESFPNMPAFDAGMVPDAIGLATYLKTVLQQPAETAYLRRDDVGVAAAGDDVPDDSDAGVCSQGARQPFDDGMAKVAFAI